MKIRRFLQAGWVLVTVAAVVLSVAPARAASNGLGIAPRKNYTVAPGTSTSDTLYINNLSQSQPLTVTLRAIDFSAKDESGSPALQLNANAPAVPWSLKSFIKVPNEVTVPAGKSVNVPFSIAIPAGQGGGSYYSAIEYTASNGSDKNVTLAASSVTLVFVTVPGQAHESLKLKQFGAFTPDSDGIHGSFSSWFWTSPPKELAYRLENSGNVAEMPTGSIVLKSTFGKQVITIEQANPKQQLALIGQTRRFEACINPTEQTSAAASGQPQSQVVCKTPKLKPGRYTAQLDLFYGLNGNPSQEVVATATFWYLPLWCVVLALLVVAAVVAAIWWLVRKLRRPNKKK